MEGCPKTPMINFDLKEPVPIEDSFEKPLSQYIQAFYHEEPSSYKNEIQQISNLRKNIGNIPHDIQGCKALRRYFTQLHYLQSRFPMYEGGEVAVPFVWYDVYNSDPVMYKDIRYEQACILFNIGGLYSQLAGKENRTSEESLKTAVQHFKSAAGAYQYLKDNYLLTDFVDMTEEILSLKIKIMLGQAVECILEKSILDNKNPTSVARVATQIACTFNDCINLLGKSGTAEMGSDLRKSWTKHLKVKILSYEAISYMYMSTDANQQEKFGEKVTYLKAASQKINEALKLLKNQGDERINYIADVIQVQLEDAVKNNDFIYHMMVPDINAMEQVKGIDLAKPVPFPYNDKDVAGPDIFQRLVPMKAHEASSLYSEKKASLLREVSNEVEEKDIALSQYLSAMKVEDLLDPKEDALPDDLQDKNKFLRDNPDVIPKAERMVEELASLSSELDGALKESKVVLDEEIAVDAQENGGKQMVVLKEYEKELIQCTTVHTEGQTVNMRLVQTLIEKKGTVQFLSRDPQIILESLPPLHVIDNTVDDHLVQRLREILGKVDKMRTQRQSLLTQLREELNKDDVTSQLAVLKDTAQQELFFEEQIKKHDKTVAYLKQNLTAQENIIQALTEANAKYAVIREKELVNKERFDNKVRFYLNEVKIFLGVQDRIRSSGLIFFKDLHKQVIVLHKKIVDFSNERKKKRPSKNVHAPSRPTARKPKLMGTAHAPIPPSSIPHINPITAINPQFTDPNLPLRHPMNAAAMHRPHLPMNVSAPGGIPANIRQPGTLMQQPPIRLPHQNMPRQPIAQVRPISIPPPQSPRHPVGVGPMFMQDNRQNIPRFVQENPNNIIAPQQQQQIMRHRFQNPNAIVGISRPQLRGNQPTNFPHNSNMHSPQSPALFRAVSSDTPSNWQMNQQPQPSRFSRPMQSPAGPNQLGMQRPPPQQPSQFQPRPGFDQARRPDTSMYMQRPLAPSSPMNGVTPVVSNSLPQPLMPQRNSPPSVSPELIYPRSDENRGDPFSNMQSFHQQQQRLMQPQQQQQPVRPQMQQPSNVRQPFVQHQRQSPQIRPQGSPQSFIPQRSHEQAPQSLPQPLQPVNFQQQSFQQPQQQPLQPQQQPLQPQQQPLRPQQQPLQADQRQQPFQTQQPLQPQRQQQPLQHQQSLQSQKTLQHQQHISQPWQSRQQPEEQQQLALQPRQQQFIQPQQQFTPGQKQISQQSQSPLQQQQNIPTQLRQQLFDDKGISLDQQAPFANAQMMIPLPSESPDILSASPSFKAGASSVKPLDGQWSQYQQSKSLLYQQQQSPQQPTSDFKQQHLLSNFKVEQQQEKQPIYQAQRPPQQPIMSEPQKQVYIQPQHFAQQQQQPFSQQLRQPNSSSIFSSSVASAPPSLLDSDNIITPRYTEPPFQRPGGGGGGQQSNFQTRSSMFSQQSETNRFQNTMVTQRSQPSAPMLSTPLNAPYNGQYLPPQPFSNPSVVSSSLPASLLTGKPLMSSSQHDPIISNILGKPTPPSSQSPATNYPSADMNQFNMQQFQLQQALMYQQQQNQQQMFIIQSLQQNQHKSEEEVKLHNLENDIASIKELLKSNAEQLEHKSVENDKDSQIEMLLKAFLVKQQQQKTSTVTMQPPPVSAPILISHSTSPIPPTGDETNNQQQEVYSPDVILPRSLESQILPSKMEEPEKLQNEGGEAFSVTNDINTPSLTSTSVVLPTNSKQDIEDKDFVKPREVVNHPNESDLRMIPVSTDIPEVNTTTAHPSFPPVMPLEQPSFTPLTPSAHPSLPPSSPDELILPRDTSEVAPSVPSSHHVIATADDEVAGGKGDETQTIGKGCEPTMDATAELINAKDLGESCRFSPIQSPSMRKKLGYYKSSSLRSSPRSSPNASARSSGRSSPTLTANGQVVQLDDMDNKERRHSDVIDHRHLARQLGRMSFYVGEPDEAAWRKHISDLAVQVEKFSAYCKSLCKPLPNSNVDGFKRIWDDLAKQEQLDIKNFTATAGETNVSKNRYRDILPWDHSRVKLSALPNDYINATHIENLTPQSPPYIATQGPIPQTFEDFWSMVWEQRSSVIVMLTNEIEGHKLKCHPYWSRDMATMKVEVLEEKESLAWKIRNFKLTNTKENETRFIKHFQFTSWPDYGTPESPYELLSFMEEVHLSYNIGDPSQVYPIILHCSAGVGRTGSFCCIYSAIKELEGKHGLIDMPGVIRKLRQSRQFMVQRMEQMIFCFQAICCFAQQFVDSERQKLQDCSRSQSLHSSGVFEEDSFVSPGPSKKTSLTVPPPQGSIISTGPASVDTNTLIESIKPPSESLESDSETKTLVDSTDQATIFKISSGIFQTMKSENGDVSDDAS